MYIYTYVFNSLFGRYKVQASLGLACGGDRGRHIEERIHRMYRRTEGPSWTEAERKARPVSVQPRGLKDLSQTSFSSILTLPNSNICKIKASATVFPGHMHLNDAQFQYIMATTSLSFSLMVCFVSQWLYSCLRQWTQGKSPPMWKGRAGRNWC